MILAIDTSLGTSVSVVNLDGEPVSLHDTLDAMRHAEVIGDAIHIALDSAGVSAADITCVSAGVGPGPFTGLRVGLAAASSFATARGIDLHPTVSHDAAALGYFDNQPEGLVRIVTDARRKEVFFSDFTGVANGLPVRASGPSLAKPEALDDTRRVHVAFVSAADLGRVAWAERRAGISRPFEPLYLRSPDVTVSAGPKRVNP